MSVSEEIMKEDKSRYGSEKTGRRILVIDREKSEWLEYLPVFFEGTSAEILWAADAEKAKLIFDQLRPEICFVNPEILSVSMIQKMKVRCETDPSFHLFCLESGRPQMSQLPFLCAFRKADRGLLFLHKFTKHLKLPKPIRVLMADDDEEIRRNACDYFGRYSPPEFEMICAEDGARAISLIKETVPDIVLLDFRMPEKNGLEVYESMQALEKKIPVIAYFDIFSSEQVMGLYRLGRPMIIDKSGEFSSMLNLAALIKKIFYLESLPSS